MNSEKIKWEDYIRYDYTSGKFFYINSNHPKQVIGAECGSPNKLGYISISLNKERVLGHRLAWYLHYGKWPDGVIDHINLNPTDNRITNLRDVTRRINQENRVKAQRNSTTKLLGAFKYKQRYRSQIQAGGMLYHLGVFETAEEAHEAYVRAKRILHEGNTL